MGPVFTFMCLVICDGMLDVLDFYLVTCWIFLYSFEQSCTLFWDRVRLLGKSLFYGGLAFKLCWLGPDEHLVRVCGSPLLWKDPSDYCP